MEYNCHIGYKWPIITMIQDLWLIDVYRMGMSVFPEAMICFVSSFIIISLYNTVSHTGAQVLGVKGRDASTTVPEEQWYWARNDWGYLDRYCRLWDSKFGIRDLVCLDVFSASRGFQKMFEQHGHKSASYDIKTDGRFDITTKEGFKNLLTLGLQNLVWMKASGILMYFDVFCSAALVIA